MRDTLILIAVLAGITFGYFQLRRTASAPQSQTQVTQIKDKANRTSGRASSQNRNQGDRDERSTFEQALSSEAPGTQEGDSGEIAEAKSITSIYSQPGEAKKSTRVTAKKHSKKRSAIGGFDSASYLANRKTKFQQYPVVGRSDEGLRVYLMCMEVRGSNLESKSASDCRALYKDNLATRAGNSSSGNF